MVVVAGTDSRKLSPPGVRNGSSNSGSGGSVQLLCVTAQPTSVFPTQVQRHVWPRRRSLAIRAVVTMGIETFWATTFPLCLLAVSPLWRSRPPSASAACGATLTPFQRGWLP